jgi:hypothetical protein
VPPNFHSPWARLRTGLLHPWCKFRTRQRPQEQRCEWWTGLATAAPFAPWRDAPGVSRVNARSSRSGPLGGDPQAQSMRYSFRATTAVASLVADGRGAHDQDFIVAVVVHDGPPGRCLRGRQTGRPPDDRGNRERPARFRTGPSTQRLERLVRPVRRHRVPFPRATA